MLKKSLLLVGINGFFALLTALFLVVGVGAAGIVETGCGPRPPRTPAEEEAIVIAEDTCEELADASDEAWAELLCKIGGGVARHVFVSRPQWQAVKTLHLKTTDWQTARAKKLGLVADGGGYE